MAFDIYDFTQVGQQGEGSLWSYDNGDSVATILTAGYFNDAAYAIIAGDTILLPQQGPSVTLDVQSVTNGVVVVFLRGENPLSNPSFTYTGGLLTGITYGGGQTKALSYTNGLLTSIVLTADSVVTTKTLNYTNGVLTSITES